MSERVPTGIEGFDVLVEGGFPRRTINLISGPAGSGKSLFALHYCLTGASRFGEPAMYLVLEETQENVERGMKRFGMASDELKRQGLFFLIDLGELRMMRGSRNAASFEELQDFLSASLRKGNIRRLVIDSLSAVGLHYSTAEAFREGLFAFSRFLREEDVTTLLLAESPEGELLTRYGIEQFLADSFTHLGLEETKGQLRRTITVRKMRFTKHDTVKHPVYISDTGLTVLADEKVV